MRPDACAGVVVAIAALAALGCPGQPAVPDVGDVDASARYAGADVNDAAAGPWQPAFEPRRVYQDPAVSCAPLAPLTYVALPRDPAEPGALIWRQPATDAALFAAIAELPVGLTETYAWTAYGFTGAVDGGFTAYGSDSIRADYGADGMFRGIGGAPTVFPSHAGTMARGEATGALIAMQDGVAARLAHDEMHQTRDFLLPVDFPSLPSISSEVSAAWRRRVAGSLPAIHTESGRAIWLGVNYVASTCVSSSEVEWIVEYDVPPFGWNDTAIQALDDGSVVVAAGADFARINSTGDVIARRRESAAWGGLTTACGMAVHTGDMVGPAFMPGTERLERWDPTDLSTIVSSPLGPSPAGVYFGDTSLGADCAVQVVRTDLSDGTGVATYSIVSFAEDGSLAWTLSDYEGRGPRIPLEDAGFLSFSYPNRITAHNADASVRWHAQYGGGNWIGGSLLMPDGTLYALAEGADGMSEFLAVNVGVGPAPLAYRHSGANWARLSGPLFTE